MALATSNVIAVAGSPTSPAWGAQAQQPCTLPQLAQGGLLSKGMATHPPVPIATERGCPAGEPVVRARVSDVGAIAVVVLVAAGGKRPHEARPAHEGVSDTC